MVAGDELGVGLGQVERRARRLGDPADEEDEEADDLGTMNQSVASCFETIAVSCSDWPISTTPSTLSASDTS